jgi:hypothetical protein
MAGRRKLGTILKDSSPPAALENLEEPRLGDRDEGRSEEPMRKLAVSCLVAAISCGVSADGVAAKSKSKALFDGSKLVQICERQGAPTNASMCVGYILGIMDMAQVRGLVGERLPWCFPDDMTVRDALIESISAVEAYLQSNPQLEQGGATIISAALTARFPCSEPEPSPDDPSLPEEPSQPNP